jgi:aldehyde dehydrogenase family protein
LQYRHARQTCVCANRILVQNGVYDASTKRLAETAGAMKVADASALVAKRADILFEIGELEKKIDQLRTELVHLDAVLRMFRPNFKAEGLPVCHRRPTKSPYFAHGELTKRIYDAMRVSGDIASVEIAITAMRDKGLDPDNDPVTRTDFVRRVTLQLNDMVRKGNAEKIRRGRAMRWRWPALSQMP